MTYRLVLAAAVALVTSLQGLPARAELRLVMVEQDGCIYCARWDAEIAPIYPRTREATVAPLRRVDLRAIPGDLALARPARFTPTFILTRDGAELSRIEGYPGEDFFWGLLEMMLKNQPEWQDSTADQATESAG